MSEKKTLPDKIIEKANNMPLEEQKHILDVVKAMVFSRKIVQKETENEQDFKE